MGDITKHFSMYELIHSDKALELSIDNTPTREIKERLVILTKRVLEPMREFIDEEIFVSSGYRCPLLNFAVGGVEDSSHMYGYTADIVCVHLDKLFEWARHHLSYDKIILENSNGKRWIHVSYKGAGLNRDKAYIYKNGAYNEV